MSAVMHVKESETGLVRVFAVDLPVQDALAFKDRTEALPGLLGIDALQDGHWELFDTADLAGMGLETYLAEGHGIAEDELAPHRWALDALEGAVLLLRSAALPDKPVTLTPRAPLRWVATFGEEKAPVPIRSDLSSASATGSVGTPTATPTSPRGSLVVVGLGLLLTAAIAFAIFMLLKGTS